MTETTGIAKIINHCDFRSC